MFLALLTLALWGNTRWRSRSAFHSATWIFRVLSSSLSNSSSSSMLTSSGISASCREREGCSGSLPLLPWPLSRTLEGPHGSQSPAGRFWSSNVAVRDSTAKAGHLGARGRGDRWVNGSRGPVPARCLGPNAPGTLGLALVSPLGCSSHQGKQAWSNLGMSASEMQERGWLLPFQGKVSALGGGGGETAGRAPSSREQEEGRVLGGQLQLEGDDHP